jgi:signal transduction histidine kinase
MARRVKRFARPIHPLAGGSTRALTRAAFAVIGLFVLAQVVWWLIFIVRLVDRQSEARMLAWMNDLESVNRILVNEPEALTPMLSRYPHLRAVAGEVRVEIDDAAVSAAEGANRSVRRMVMFEGPFFAVVILLLLSFIAGSLRAERELKRRQANFLSAVTHEFNTPITTLRLLLQTMQLRTLSPERSLQHLRQMEGELDRLQRTGAQVLAAARLEQSPEPPVLKAVDLNAAVQGIVGRSRAGLSVRGAQLIVHYAPEPVPVSLDLEAFALVLENLFDNAVKYSLGDAKPIRVTIIGEPEVVRLVVEDEGVGIPATERERVFERFYRSGEELTRTASGVGLGLHLVRSITEAMNGWVSVSAGSEGRGTRFTLTFMRRIGETEATSGAQGVVVGA